MLLVGLSVLLHIVLAALITLPSFGWFRRSDIRIFLTEIGHEGIEGIDFVLAKLLILLTLNALFQKLFIFRVLYDSLCEDRTT